MTIENKIQSLYPNFPSEYITPITFGIGASCIAVIACVALQRICHANPPALQSAPPLKSQRGKEKKFVFIPAPSTSKKAPPELHSQSQIRTPVPTPPATTVQEPISNLLNSFLVAIGTNGVRSEICFSIDEESEHFIEVPTGQDTNPFFEKIKQLSQDLIDFPIEDDRRHAIEVECICRVITILLGPFIHPGDRQSGLVIKNHLKKHYPDPKQLIKTFQAELGPDSHSVKQILLD